jgi:hypothetical protein
MATKQVTVNVEGLEGQKVAVETTTDATIKEALEKAGQYDPGKYTYRVSGAGIAGGSELLEEANMSQMLVEEGDTVFIAPKVVGGK